MILVHWLPHYETVYVSQSAVLFFSTFITDSRQLTRLPARYKRRHWTLGEQRRYDPRILSVCKQLYEEASDILYHTSFIIDVNCGDVACSEHELPGTDWRWRDTNLTGRFPFHKANQLTLRVDVNTGQEPDHLFHHMVHICGLLFSEASYLKDLRIEISNSHAYRDYLDSNCLSWQNADITGTAAKFNVKQAEWPTHPDYDVEAQSTMVERINFFLKPLALPGRAQHCKFNISDDIPMTKSLKDIVLHYEEALTDKRPFGYEESRWLWDQYLSILDQQDESKRNQQRLNAEIHDVWLVNTHQRYKCKHQPRAAKKYSRHCGKDAQCDGCRKWFHYLMECRKCSVRACTSCMSDLRKEISPLQKAKIHDAWLFKTHQWYDCKHHPRAAKRYRRPCGKDARCDGCEKEFHWLVACRDCKLRACASCTSELRKKRPVLQERVRLEVPAYW